MGGCFSEPSASVSVRPLEAYARNERIHEAQLSRSPGIESRRNDQPSNSLPLRAFLREEVALHNTPNDCWIILNGKVYDLTIFARSHPGGSAVIRAAAGTDASRTFTMSHSLDDPQTRLSQYCLGHVAKDSPTSRKQHARSVKRGSGSNHSAARRI